MSYPYLQGCRQDVSILIDDFNQEWETYADELRAKYEKEIEDLNTTIANLQEELANK